MSSGSLPTKTGLRLVALLLPLLVGMTPGEAATPSGSFPSCVHATASAPFRGIGYDHILTLQNTCRSQADCTVTTDVNPSPIHAAVPSGETVDVLTYRGSPSSEFHADVTCTLAS